MLALLVAAHIATIIVAVQGGLSAVEVLARTRGSWLWGGFYGLFVLAVAVHGPIGLRSVVRELTPWRKTSLDWAALAVAVVVLSMGLRAVAAVVL